MVLAIVVIVLLGGKQQPLTVEAFPAPSNSCIDSEYTTYQEKLTALESKFKSQQDQHQQELQRIRDEYKQALDEQNEDYADTKDKYYNDKQTLRKQYEDIIEQCQDDGPVCGNGMCESGETRVLCSLDCNDANDAPGDPNCEPVYFTRSEPVFSWNETISAAYYNVGIWEKGIRIINENTTATTYKPRNLTPGNYNYRVRALNSKNWSGGWCNDKAVNFTIESETNSCGNNICDAHEDKWSCPNDCDIQQCGDGKCDPGEVCSQDCNPDQCGDRICQDDETPTSCAEDCFEPICGNNKCEAGEEHNCASDCAVEEEYVCGNNICELDGKDGESYWSCKADCPSQIACNDGYCRFSETENGPDACAADCNF